MFYKAEYGEDGYTLAIQSVLRMVQNDAYYSMYGGGGTFLAFRTRHNGCWDDYELRHSGKRVDSLLDVQAEDLFPEVTCAGWVTCRGNAVVYYFDHSNKTVIMTVKGRRHGIPDVSLKGLRPIAVLEYKTHRPTWDWWETSDDHQKEGG